MTWKWWRRLKYRKAEQRLVVYKLRYSTLRELGKYYRHIHFDRIKAVQLEDGTEAEVIMCYYCDGIAEHRDHVYPVSALTRDIIKRRLNYKKMKKLPLYIVPACARCNLLLKDRVFNTLNERQRYIQRRLKIGY